jgi:hypothetical protein
MKPHRLKHPTKWEKQTWKPQTIIYEATDEPLTAGAGLGPLIDAFVQTPEFEELKKCLPVRVSNASFSPEHLALIILAGFWYGHECLDDLDDFADDPSIEAKLGGLASSRTIGNYLRDFNPENLEDMRRVLTKQAFSYRTRIDGEDVSITFDQDATFHQQYGPKMEGVVKTRYNAIGLDSLHIFDDRGFSYDMDLRPGSTFSAQKADTMIKAVLDHISNRLDVQHYYRADSAYCNEDCITAAISKGLKGTVTAHGNTGWASHISEIVNWKPWIYTLKEIEKAQEQGKKLPEIEVGYWMYEPGWAPGVEYPIVVKRTPKKEDEEQPSLINDERFKYWGVLSFRGLYPLTPQQILEIHQGRGHMENFIKEGKINYDLKHFPCQSLMANHVYGLFALIAHNFLRAMALLMRPDKPHFAKKLRKKMIHIPGRIVKGAGYLKLKMPTKFFKEVMEFLTRWLEPFKPARDLSTA